MKKFRTLPVMHADNELATILSSTLEDLPQAEVERKANHISFLIGQKVFAYTQGGKVVMKLPKERVEELNGRKNISTLVMGKRVMKKWIVIEHEKPEEYKEELALFKETMTFVSSKS